MNRPNTCTNLIKAVNRIADAGRGLAVLETVDEAVAWANELIERIDKV